jgi:hypothetical protein
VFFLHYSLLVYYYITTTSILRAIRDLVLCAPRFYGDGANRHRKVPDRTQTCELLYVSAAQDAWSVNGDAEHDARYVVH